MLSALYSTCLLYLYGIALLKAKMPTLTRELHVMNEQSTYLNNAGKYQDDYDRLMNLVPSTQTKKAEFVAGEIMRAITKLNQNNGNLNNDLFDTLNFLAMVGIFDNDKSTLATIYPYAKGEKHYEGHVQMALERIIDLSIEFLLTYPDLEWTENAVDMMRTLSKKGIDFMERVLDCKQQHEVHSPSMSKVLQVPPQEIKTPRIANKDLFDVAVKV